MEKENIITVESVKNLIGKKIEVFSEGYNGQDLHDTFTVKGIEKEKFIREENGVITEGYHDRDELITMEGKRTYIFFNENGVAYCGDVDRYVYYKVVK